MGAPQRSGLVKGRHAERMTLRVRLVGGALNAAQVKRLGEVAETYGNGQVHLTTRQGVELPQVPVAQIEEAAEALAEVGLSTGSTGPTVRSIVACAGDQCRHALTDSQAVARKVNAHLAGLAPLPHKFKIGVTGCPNSCAKPRENDLGIMGTVRVELDVESCNECGACLDQCPQPGALDTDMHGTPVLNAEVCSRCGYCVEACPQEAWKVREELFALYVGGRMGRHPKLATRLAQPVRSDAELMAAIDAIVAWYGGNGMPKERFAETIERLGEESLTAVVEARVAAAG